MPGSITRKSQEKCPRQKSEPLEGFSRKLEFHAPSKQKKLAVGCKLGYKEKSGRLIMKPEGCRTQTLEDWGRQPTPSTGGCWYAAEVSRHTSTKGGSKSAGKFD